MLEGPCSLVFLLCASGAFLARFFAADFALFGHAVSTARILVKFASGLGRFAAGAHTP